MINAEDLRRYKELSAKDEEELTDEEYNELMMLQYRDTEEMCTTMSYLGM